MANRITKKDNFIAIIDILTETGFDELAEVMRHEVELLDRKNANRSHSLTPTQRENEDIKAHILANLEPGVWYKIGDIKQMTPILRDCNGTQRTAALLNRMLLEDKVEKKNEKRVVYFRLK